MRRRERWGTAGGDHAAGSPGYDDMLTDNSLVSFLTSLSNEINSYDDDDDDEEDPTTGSGGGAIIPSYAYHPPIQHPPLVPSASSSSSSGGRRMQDVIDSHTDSRYAERPSWLPEAFALLPPRSRSAPVQQSLPMASAASSSSSLPLPLPMPLPMRRKQKPPDMCCRVRINTHARTRAFHACMHRSSYLSLLLPSLFARAGRAVRPTKPPPRPMQPALG